MKLVTAQEVQLRRRKQQLFLEQSSVQENLSYNDERVEANKVNSAYSHTTHSHGVTCDAIKVMQQRMQLERATGPLICNMIDT